MSRRNIYLAAALALALAAGLGHYSYVSPVTTLENIKKAAQQNDKDRLRDLIDFDSVKTGLKEDIKAQLMASGAESLKDNPFAALGVALASMIVDPLVESIVSPAGITRLVENGQVGSRKMDAGIATLSEPAEKPTAAEGVTVQYGYDDFSHYRVRMHYPRMSSGQSLTLTLRREGLFSWKLARVSIPDDMLEDAAKAKSTRSLPRADMPNFESSDMQADPRRENVVVLNAVIRNGAAFAQEFPALEITLTDADERPLVRRVLRAADYAPGLAPAMRGQSIAPGSEAVLRLLLDTGGVRAAGYRLYLFYPDLDGEPATRELYPEQLRVVPG